MLGWIGRTAEAGWNWVTGAAGFLWHKVVHFVYGVVHGVIGWLEGFWGVIKSAWGAVSSAVTALWKTIEAFATEAANFLYTLVTHTIPSVFKKIAHAAVQAWNWVENAVKWAAKHISHAVQQAWHWVQNAIKWVHHNLISPIWTWIKHTGQHILHWAHDAWSLITHPAKLAEILFWPMWWFFTHVAWKVARKIGVWVTELVLHNLVRMVNLVEGIIADVL